MAETKPKTPIELLKEMEWSSFTGGVFDCCPSCGQHSSEGHSGDCALNAAISAPQNTSQVQQTTDLLEKQTILHKLAQDPSPSVRAGVAGNLYISHDTMWLLARDTRRSVLQALAGNTRAPDDLLRELAKNKTCLATLAYNIQTPSDVLEVMAKKCTVPNRPYYLSTLIDHINISDESLKHIQTTYAGKKNQYGSGLDYLAKAAGRTLKARSANKPAPVWKRAHDASLDNLSLEDAHRFANDTNQSVRLSLAENLQPNVVSKQPLSVAPTPIKIEASVVAEESIKPITAEEVWQDLLVSPSWQVRRNAVVSIPKALYPLLVLVANDPNVEVARAVGGGDLPHEVLEIQSRHCDEEVRYNTAGNDRGGMTQEILQRLARDSSPKVRMAAVKNAKFGKPDNQSQSNDVGEESPAQSKSSKSNLGTSVLAAAAGIFGGAMANAMLKTTPAVRVTEIDPIETMTESIQEITSDVAK